MELACSARGSVTCEVVCSGDGDTLFSLVSLSVCVVRYGSRSRLYTACTSEGLASSQLNLPFIGVPASKSKFHFEAASFLAFFISFLTNLRFSSWSVGPNRALLTLWGLAGGGWGGLSSSEELELLLN